MSAQTIAYSGQLVVSTCWCGMRHAVPSELLDHQERAHNDGREVPSIYCPLGHQYVPAGEGEAARAKRRLKYAQDDNARLDAEREQAEASARAYKGAATKARKRAKAGTCPCCKRTFQQLSNHMRRKHPDFDPEAV